MSVLELENFPQSASFRGWAPLQREVKGHTPLATLASGAYLHLLRFVLGDDIIHGRDDEFAGVEDAQSHKTEKLGDRLFANIIEPGDDALLQIHHSYSVAELTISNAFSTGISPLQSMLSNNIRTERPRHLVSDSSKAEQNGGIAPLIVAQRRQRRTLLYHTCHWYPLDTLWPFRAPF